MIVYIVELEDLKWSSKKLWGEFPDIYPDLAAAEKILKCTPSTPSKPIWNAEFYGFDVSKIEIVPYKFDRIDL